MALVFRESDTMDYVIKIKIVVFIVIGEQHGKPVLLHKGLALGAVAPPNTLGVYGYGELVGSGEEDGQVVEDCLISYTQLGLSEEEEAEIGDLCMRTSDLYDELTRVRG
jgi:hypothetical protein